MDFVDEVLQGLESLRQLDAKRQIFGAGAHDYLLNPPVTPAELVAFEKKWRCQLPEDYRTFLLELGNGGAGPYYGVFPLGMGHGGHEPVDYEDWKFDLSAPFPHTKAWNDETLLDEGAPEREDFESDEKFEEAERAWQNSDAAFAARDAYYDAYGEGQGSVPICHHGCGFVDWLVVTGPEAGHVWHSRGPDQLGIEPVTTKIRARTTFSQWYLDWLRQALVEAGGQR